MSFCLLTRKSGVLLITGLENTRIFQTIFNQLQKKASAINYSDGSKKSLKPRNRSGSIELTEVLLSLPDIEFNKITFLKQSPNRELNLDKSFRLF